MVEIRLLIFLFLLSLIKFGLAVAQTLLATLEYSQLKRIFYIWGYKSQLEELNRIVITTKSMLEDAEPKPLYNKAVGYVDKLKGTLSKPDDIFHEFVTFFELKQLKELPTKHGRVYQEIYCFYSSHRTFANKPSYGAEKLPKELNAFTGIHRNNELDTDCKPICTRREDNVGRNDDKEANIDKLLEAEDNDDKEANIDKLLEAEDNDDKEANIDKLLEAEDNDHDKEANIDKLLEAEDNDHDKEANIDELLEAEDNDDKEANIDKLLEAEDNDHDKEANIDKLLEAEDNDDQEANIDKLLEAEDSDGGNLAVQFGDNESQEIEIGEMSYRDVENAEINLISSHESSSEHGLDEYMTATDTEQPFNQDFHSVSIPESNFRGQQNSEDAAILWVFYSVPKKILFNKWLYRLLNVILELLQITFTEVNDRRKMSNSVCYKLIFITSSICLLISLGEFIIKAKQSKAVWRRTGILYWFHFPGADGRLFGGLSLNFVVISSATQFCVNLAILVMNKKFFHADYLALLLAIVGLICPEKTEELE